MKKILTSTGLIVLGAASLNAAYAPGLSSMNTAKPWSLSAALRGFYDDNYATSPANPGLGIPAARSSYGFELAPSASINLPMDQTFFGASYTYSMKYYNDRPNHKADHSHQFTAKLDHAFSERYKLELSESFVMAQEPQLIDPSGITTFPLRAEGNNIHNIGTIGFTAQMTRQVGLEFTYANNYYDYNQKGVGSLSALLNRMEHLFAFNSRWTIQPQTVGILGYQYGQVDYSSNDALFVGPLSPSGKIRDNRSHYGYVGVDQNFNEQLNGSVRVGAQYTTYRRLSNDTVSPYVDANLTYTYNPGSYLQAGFKHARNQTDFAGSAAGLTVDQESSSLYASVNHKITPKMTGSLLGQYQHSTFRGGTADAKADDYFTVGLNVSYQFNNWISGEAGYNYDKLRSDLGGRGYDRNRVYIGVRATY